MCLNKNGLVILQCLLTKLRWEADIIRPVEHQLTSSFEPLQEGYCGSGIIEATSLASQVSPPSDHCPDSKPVPGRFRINRVLLKVISGFLLSLMVGQ